MILLDYPEEALYYITAVCTVDLEMPNSVAAERTVARLSMMYAAKSQARSSIFVYKYTTPHTLVLNLYESTGSDMCRPAGHGTVLFLQSPCKKTGQSPRSACLASDPAGEAPACEAGNGHLVQAAGHRIFSRQKTKLYICKIRFLHNQCHTGCRFIRSCIQFSYML